MSENANQEQIQNGEENQEGQDSQLAEAGGDSSTQDNNAGKDSAPKNAQQQPKSIPDWRFNEVNERMKAAEARLAQIQAQPPQPQPKNPADQAPKPEDFSTYEEYVRADARFVARQEAQQEFQKARQADQQQAQQWSAQERVRKADESFNTKLHEALAKDPALLTTLQNAPTLRPDLQLFGLKESDTPIELAKHLAANPALILQLNQMPAERALREMGKIEAKLQGSGGQAQAKVSQMPKPMPPVGTGKAAGGAQTGLDRALSVLYPP